jgi:hypothetical protein
MWVIRGRPSLGIKIGLSFRLGREVFTVKFTDGGWCRNVCVPLCSCGPSSALVGLCGPRSGAAVSVPIRPCVGTAGVAASCDVDRRQINSQITDPSERSGFNDLNRIELVAIGGCRSPSDTNVIAALEVPHDLGIFGGIDAKPNVLTANRGREGIVLLHGGYGNWKREENSSEN